jgi:hypothetical protein
MLALGPPGQEHAHARTAIRPSWRMRGGTVLKGVVWNLGQREATNVLSPQGQCTIHLCNNCLRSTHTHTRHIRPTHSSAVSCLAGMAAPGDDAPKRGGEGVEDCIRDYFFQCSLLQKEEENKERGSFRRSTGAGEWAGKQSQEQLVRVSSTTFLGPPPLLMKLDE